MEILLFIVLVAVFFAYLRGGQSRRGQGRAPPSYNRTKVPPKYRPNQRPRAIRPKQSQTPCHSAINAPVLNGRAYVIDGDSLRIQKTEIRLFGVDAPEMNHPFGKKAKWALHALCKGQTIKAVVVGTDDHARTVAKCYLADGRDLSAEMVKQGLALDWPKFSGGDYGQFEVEGVRKKLWLAAARQRGHMHLWKKYEDNQRRKNDA